MLPHHFQMLFDAVALRLMRLFGYIADIDFQGGRPGHRPRQLADEQVGDDAGVEAARPDDDHIGLLQGQQRLGVGRRVGRLQLQGAQPPVGAGDGGLAYQRFALDGVAHQRYIGGGGGNHLAANG